MVQTECEVGESPLCLCWERVGRERERGRALCVVRGAFQLSARAASVGVFRCRVSWSEGGVSGRQMVCKGVWECMGE